jgi:hypothetical protein
VKYAAGNAGLESVAVSISFPPLTGQRLAASTTKSVDPTPTLIESCPQRSFRNQASVRTDWLATQMLFLSVFPRARSAAVRKAWISLRYNGERTRA